MWKYIIKRLVQAIPLLFLISLIVFSLIYLAPYDVVDSMITTDMSDDQIAILREKYGLNKSFLAQYSAWIENVLQGNLGSSLTSDKPIASELAEKIPNTVILVLPAYLTALVIAVVLGLLAAANKGKKLDRFLDWLSSIAMAIPAFWFAMILIYIFGYQLNIFKIVGMYTVGGDESFADFMLHYTLPFTTLTVVFFPDLLRYVRSSAMNQLSENYVTVQKSFRSSKLEIFKNHISRHILIPLVTQIGLALPLLITGSIITETVFAWPGIGPYLTTATKGLDYPVIMAVMLISSSLVILGNLLADILYYIVDPRIKREGK